LVHLTSGPGSNRSIRSSALRAAWNPHMPCTPPPGGVDPEQMNTRELGVV
jgi:hypothetical protein